MQKRSSAPFCLYIEHYNILSHSPNTTVYTTHSIYTPCPNLWNAALTWLHNLNGLFFVVFLPGFCSFSSLPTSKQWLVTDGYIEGLSLVDFKSYHIMPHCHNCLPGPPVMMWRWYAPTDLKVPYQNRHSFCVFRSFDTDWVFLISWKYLQCSTLAIVICV